ncbi:MAG: GNAT family N-acetyltransferase [Chloroflexota bacterium]
MIRYTTSLERIDEERLAGGFWVGWPVPPTPAQHLAMLRGAEVAVLALDADGGDVVGYVTAIGDGVLTAYLPLLEVLPAWQGRGIGSELVRRVLAELGPRYMIDVACDEDVVAFYERLGFTPYRAMVRRDRTALGRDA